MARVLRVITKVDAVKPHLLPTKPQYNVDKCAFQQYMLSFAPWTINLTIKKEHSFKVMLNKRTIKKCWRNNIITTRTSLSFAWRANSAARLRQNMPTDRAISRGSCTDPRKIAESPRSKADVLCLGWWAACQGALGSSGIDQTSEGGGDILVTLSQPGKAFLY